MRTRTRVALWVLGIGGGALLVVAALAAVIVLRNAETVPSAEREAVIESNGFVPNSHRARPWSRLWTRVRARSVSIVPLFRLSGGTSRRFTSWRGRAPTRSSFARAHRSG